MGSSICIVNESEERTRKHWLLSSSFNFFLCPAMLFAFFVAFSERFHIPDDTTYGFLVYAIIGLIPLWMGWHFSYRKHGTRLLTFWLVVGPFGMITSFAEASQEAHNAWVTALLTTNIVVFVWWYLLSIKLRKINKSIQERKSFIPQIQTD